MELPIDHFHLLGVQPTTDAQSVLRTLQQRLDRVPDQGFTQDTLQARAELLRNSADLLSDEARRRAYEAQLLTINATGAGSQIAALEIPASREVAGLLLLFEAGLAQEAFETARRNLQPPQAPALGSSREADLTLLAGLACLAAAKDYQEQRRFEAAATVLQQGLQLLQRMGQLPQQRRLLEQQLGRLLPYRVLDLVSRDLGAASDRAEGLKLLEELVQRRGGLDGDSDRDFDQSKFQTFFKQIRPFLTVQEQVDLFSRWAQASSATADFLASYALTASGFAQRKPERIREAYGRLAAASQLGIEPFLACQQLLLGQVDQAEAHFDRGASPELRQWASEQGSESLERLCAYCRDWLAREVLPGYRDIEVDADLDAWFADRDVQAYVEQQDRRSSRQGAAGGRELAATPNASTAALGQDSAPPAPWNAPWLDSSDLGLPTGSASSPARGLGRGPDSEDEGSQPGWPRGLRLPAMPWQAIPWPGLLGSASEWAASRRPRLKLRQRWGSGLAKVKLARPALSRFQPGRLAPKGTSLGGISLRNLLPPWGGQRPAGEAETVAEGPLAPGTSVKGDLFKGEVFKGDLFKGARVEDPLAAGQRPEALAGPDLGLAAAAWPDQNSPAAEPAASPNPFGPLPGREPLGAPHPLTLAAGPPEPTPGLAWPFPLVATVAGVAVAGVVLGGWLALRPKPEQGIPLPVLPLASQPDSSASRGGASRTTPKPKAPQPDLPLQVTEPTEAQLQRLLEAWLQAKAAVLSGKAPAIPPSQLAVGSLVGALDQSRQADLDRGESLKVTTKVTRLQITSRSQEQIEASVTLLYGDERRSQDGKLLEQTPQGERHNSYVFGRNQQNWKLERVIFQPSQP